MKLRTVLTCGACPEQYDVLDDKDKEVGYLRLRWGGFTADVTINGFYEEVYSYTYDNQPMLGLFPSEEERQLQIKKALKAIKKELERRNIE